MARDYGTRRAARKKSNGPQQFLVVIVTFLLGYLTATVFDLQKLTQWMNSQVLESQEAKQPVKSAHKNPEVPPKPKFEFYTLLANEKDPKAAQANKTAPQTNAANTATTTTKATVPGSQAASATATAALKPTVVNAQQIAKIKVTEGKPLRPISGKQESFLVQVAAFKARSDAEHMKGLLTLKGFNVNVVPITNGHGNWFRVVIGPYSNRGLAQQAQGTLARSEHLKGMITPYRG